MKLTDWYGADPRRRPFHWITDCQQPSHWSLGTSWTDERGDVWRVLWAPRTGEVYGVGPDDEVRVVGRLHSDKAYWAVWSGLGDIEDQPGAFDRLPDLLTPPSEAWHLDDGVSAPHQVVSDLWEGLDL